MPTIAIEVDGKVQGVFYRASVKKEADKLGLTGWVKNESSGSVLIRATGDATALEELTRWCADGPDGAEVSKVKVEALPDEVFGNFEIKR